MKNPSVASLSFLFLLLVMACGQESKQEFDGSVKVSGVVKNAPEGRIELYKFVNESTEIIGEIPMGSGGDFEYELSLEGPAFFELHFMNQKIVKLALFAEDVEVFYDFNDEASLKVEGSEDSQNLQKIEALTAEYQKTINELNTAYFEAMSKRDQEAIKSIQTTAMNLEVTQGQKVKEVLTGMEGSFATMAGISMLNIKNDFQYIDELVAGLNEKYPNTKMIQSLMNQLDDMRALSIGQVAPEISLPNPNGELIKLSDLRGKYVLIDFWAAWCRPCREENPNVVRLYNQYKDQGFEVFGVSLDRTKEAWVKAIADDNLTWTHVSDLKYFNSEAAAIYQINAIPATYMLDPEGKIIGKDLRGASLENKLKEIFE
ncbi:peroxiredoxin family protein [Aquiflexum gelatinilyticum]|uniref:peroxiredoxin family protein n=1 Tax=Aquiflexum gelatinilyticum TaxID=2961943 RepID=UPI00216A77B3|nr:TlpA disulfide reductase family protein [Aquiflexum gelatinilyticum]MCS4434593.1 TlpA family protein disulfide reductase [Aquiflexum gelatinilyticum]